ncbi:hypothetical protein Tco_1149466, partial [Tanacetum coccineum]
SYCTDGLREIASKADLRDYWSKITSNGDLLGAVPFYTSIRDSLRRPCHRLIAFSISKRGQACREEEAGAKMCRCKRSGGLCCMDLLSIVSVAYE